MARKLVFWKYKFVATDKRIKPIKGTIQFYDNREETRRFLKKRFTKGKLTLVKLRNK